jgi:CDP-glucose 4,6-dehydratase
MEALVGASRKFWRGKRVLLTGHTGFKGSWLALWLEMMGAEVTGLSLAPPDALGGTPLWLALGKPGGEMIGDIRSADMVHAAFEAADPEIVLHLAAQALVHPSYALPAETFETNVMGLVQVLDEARVRSSLRAIVNVTSDKCYENSEQIWAYRESDPMGGSDPYSASKGCAELVTSSYRRSFFSAKDGPRLASARAGNVIGGGDWAADRLIPDCIRAFAVGDPLMVRNPLSTRPWQHVLEPLRGYLMLAERLYNEGDPFAEGWNFGPADDDAWPVSRIVHTVAARWGDGACWLQDPASKPHEAMLLRVDASKAKSRIGWRPWLPIEDGLKWAVDWYRLVAGGGDARQITCDQIRSYELLGDK